MCVLVAVLALVVLPRDTAAEDYYDILRLQQNCTQDDIRKAYHTLALKYHPDKNRGSDKAEAEKMFLKIAVAYELLSDPKQRASYDALREGQKAAGGEGKGSGGDKPPPGEGEKVKYHVRVPLEHIYRGGDAEVDIRVSVVCPYCGGSGHHSAHAHGVGGAPSGGSALAVGGAELQGHMYGPRCPGCGGWGSIPRTTKHQFFVPAGAYEGMKAAALFQSGAEIIIFSLPHATYRRDRMHLHADIALSFTEACTGFLVTLLSLDGRNITVNESLALRQNKFPISSGDKLTLVGEGLPCFGSPWEKGDLFLHFTVGAPENLIEAAVYSQRASVTAVRGLLKKAAALRQRAMLHARLGIAHPLSCMSR